ncbi:MAG: hypothetical protein CVV27_06790 [Candidatus Melainabacteria bacterium HGW-Melainabacteria-1]|nr:MAG: hypothetical protein CVV27_06790 [Candidatus Melainabacteria bacterium HGW-Melainabacteria-1]
MKALYPVKLTALSALLALTLPGCGAPAHSLAAQAPLVQTQAARPLRAAAANPRVMAASPTFFENRLRGFVYHWFSLFDSNAPHAEFLKRMVSDPTLEFRFPEATLRSESDFRSWYDGVLKNIRVASHTVNAIKIQKLSGNEFKVLVDVIWRGVPYQGEPVVFHASQEWHVVVKGADFNDIRIRKYLVSAANP